MAERRRNPSSALALSPWSQNRGLVEHSPTDVFLAVLADCGCTLCRQGVVLGARDDPLLLQQKLEQRLKADSSTLGKFADGFRDYVADGEHLRRILISLADGANSYFCRSDSLARVLLSLAPIQTQVASILLEKLPEHVDSENGLSGLLPNMKNSIPRLILSQFRWLDYLVESSNITNRLMEVLSICPLGLKKEIVSLLPEIVADNDHEMVVTALEQMLQEDLQLLVPILDAFSSLNLQESLLDQVVSMALTSLKLADAEDLPLVVKFLLQSATPDNVRRIVHQLRENLLLAITSNSLGVRSDRKMKCKATYVNCEGFVLEALRAGLRFQNVICEAFLKEIKGLNENRDHKAIDIWLLLIIYANGGAHRKVAELLLKKKIIAGHFGIALLRQCICGQNETLQDYFQVLVSVSGTLLTCKELHARQFGSQSYMLLFEEFTDAYHRQEVLASLVTHTGSGVAHEVDAALDALLLLSTRYSKELLPFSSFINGILDYLDGFQYNHLYQVYKVFSQLAMISWIPGSVSNGSSVANELMIVVRKQISNPDPKYKRMGIIGAISIVSCFGGVSIPTVGPFNVDTQTFIREALELLKMVLEMCKGSSAARVFFYDELAKLLETTALHQLIVDWISKQTNEFESIFLVDLDAGQLPKELRVSKVMEGEIWMNLDGDASPILLNVLTLLVSTEPSSIQALGFLPSSFHLLATVERMANQGSLGSVDALLGCPLYLPKNELLTGDAWNGLLKSQKEIACLALFYGINWIIELINSFSTQIEGQHTNLTQATFDEISAKLLKRLQNLIFLEHLLCNCMESIPSLSFPQLHSIYSSRNENSFNSNNQQINLQRRSGRGRKRKADDGQGGRDCKQTVDGRGTQVTQSNIARSKQLTISDAFNNKSREISGEPQHVQRPTRDLQENLSKRCDNDNSNGGKTSERGSLALEKTNMKGRSEFFSLVEAQRWKFRPLNVSSLAVLSISDVEDSLCCHDPASQMSAHLYLVRDLHYKLECLEQNAFKRLPWLPTMNQTKAPSGLGSMSASDLFSKLEPLFCSLRRHLDNAASILRPDISLIVEEVNNKCERLGVSESLAPCNPENSTFVASKIVVAESVFVVILSCLSKIFANRELIAEGNLPVMKKLLSAFGSSASAENICSGLHPPPSPGTMENAFCSAYACLDEYFEAAATSFPVAVKHMMALKGLVVCAQALLDNSMVDSRSHRSSFVRMMAILPYLRSKLSVSASRILKYEWKDDEQGKNWKNRGDILQQLLHMFFQYNESPMELLEEIACNILPQVPARKVKDVGSTVEYSTLRPSTFITWYCVLHKEILGAFNKVIKDIMALHKSNSVKDDDVEIMFSRTHQCVAIMVSMINLTRRHDKTSIHAVAVQYGGKFVDTFLKGIDFFQAQYEAHRGSIHALVKDLQKATRTIQTLCSEAKGMKRMPVTSKVPAVKRSLERYVFHIKALLHSTSHGSSFWMGNLKHRNLQGEEVGSQIPVSDEEDGEGSGLGQEREHQEAADQGPVEQLGDSE